VSTLFYRQWRLFALAVGMILALGAAALTTIARQEDPTITNLFATVVTPYPGADPGRVEALVTEPIEAELEEIAEIETITSTSRTAISVVQIELSSFITEQEIEQAWSEIRDALADAAVAFPAGVPEPEFDNDRTGAFTAIGAVLPRDGRAVPPSIQRRYAEALQDRLRQVPGTEIVRLFGAETEEIRVAVDPDRLAAVGLEAGAVAAAIARADAKVEAGRLRGDRADLLVEVAGEIDGLDRIRRIPVRDGDDGRILRVGDVATVERATVDPPASVAYADGTRGVLVAAKMEEDLQVDRWMADVRDELDAFAAALPGGLEHRLLFDQSRYTADRLGGLLGNLAMGVGLVVAVLLVTLGWRAALIVAAILPLTSLGTIAVLQAIGVPIHQMSVTGLIVALGLLVDAAIVMTDQVRQRLAEGLARVQAVGGAVRRLAVPLLASTVTTILAFLPMALLPGPAGDFVGSIALSVIVMLSVSLVLALTVTPALAGWMLPDRERADGGGPLGSGIRVPVLARAFEGSLRLALRHRRLAVLGALILPVAGFGAFPTLTAQFFPGVERDQFHVQLHLPGATAIERTASAAMQAEEILRGLGDVAHVHWVVGESAPSFYYNMTMTQDGVPSFAEALVTTTSAAATDDVIAQARAALDRRLPEAQAIVRELVQGPPVEAPVELRLVGPDLGTLRALGERLRAEMAAVPAITHTRATLLGGDPKLVFDLDEETVRLAGLELAEVAAQLDAALEGAVGGSLVEATEELPVRVRLGEAARGSAEAIRSLDVLPPDAPARAAAGAYPGIPLTALGAPSLEPAESPIARRDGERVNTVQGYVALGVLPEEALAAVQARLDAADIALPPGYRLEIGGDADARSETVNNLISTLGLVVTLTVATIVLTFNRFRLALVAGAVAVLSMGLSLLALAAFAYPFGIQALIGVIGSIGVSINAAIIVMTALQADERAMAGDRRRMAAIVAGASRHIVSTTLTTFGGFLPLILAGGGFWPPFAMAIAGGVLLSMVVSFYFTPPMFALVMAPAREVRQPRTAGTADAGPPGLAVGQAAE